jgi:hypothetical protein
VNDEKICPLLTNSHETVYCEDEKCAWYCTDTQKCAIAHLSTIAKGVKKNG